jgi:hypothetical protein
MQLGLLRSIESIWTPKKITREHNGLDALFSGDRYEPLIDGPFSMYVC